LQIGGCRLQIVVGVALALAGVAGIVVATPRAQAPAPSSGPTFDVTSVKPNKSGPGGPSMLQNQPGGRFTATNVPVRPLIQNAYRLQSFQLVGGPAWLDTERFDIVAKGSGDLAAPLSPVFGVQQSNDPTPMQFAMRALLADRFKLVVHHETRELPIYALVLARTDKKLGPGIHPSGVDCAALAAARGRVGAPPPGPPPLDQRPVCGMRMGFGNLSVGGMSLSQLASALSGSLGRTVLDQTGLVGAFDVDLTWTPDQMPQRAPGTPGDQPVTVNGITVDPNGPSVFTALQEQLGLKLDSTKGPMEVLVIDSAERPTED